MNVFKRSSSRGATSLTGKCVVLALVAAIALGAAAESLDGELFKNPPDSARPWVYWYFMDGNTTREGMKADLEAMKEAGIGGVLILEVSGGRVPRGPVEFLSPKWLELFGYAIAEADRLGIEVAVGTGPGWCGAGGKSVTPDDAMQHTVASETTVTGPCDFSSVLPVPKPRTPFFGMGTLTPELKEKWESYYRDVAVLAFPEPDGKARLPDADEKAIYQRAPFSSKPGVKPYLTPSHTVVAPEKCVDTAKVVNLTAKMDASGHLNWRVPEGRWTIMRVGRRLTGQTTRPAPKPGLGLETSKFDRGAIERHLKDYADKILAAAGPHRPGRGLTTLHFDSWEMSAQNGSAEFFKEFERRRGYSPLPYIPAINGRVVKSTDVTERFLFDWRQTAQELVIENHLMPIREYAHGKGLVMSSEPYDMNPCCDITSGAVADVPMCEFWSKGMGFDATYSCLEAVSIAHTMGRSVVGAEAFTASGEYWKQYPGSMKAQGDWALCFGINCFKFHTYQHQPSMTDKPGMTMCGFYGVNWHRNQTWWPMVDSYHRYLTRCQMMLRQGRPVADILYLLPEGAPMVFQPPKDAFMEGDFPDRKGYSFDGCSPEVFMSRAKFVDKKIDFEGGATYSVLVLPKVEAMTPMLMKKILECAEAEVPIVGEVPRKSPSLSGYPKCDEEVVALADRITPRLHHVPDKNAVLKVVENVIENEAKWIWSAGEKDVMKQPHGSRWFRKTFRLETPSKEDLRNELDNANPRMDFLTYGELVRRFRKGTLSCNVRGMMVKVTADNAYRLYVNGTFIGGGVDFHDVGTYRVLMKDLKPGENVIEVLADNWGDTPNPAALIVACAIEYKDGRIVTLKTDSSWTCAADKSKGFGLVQEFGAFNMGPWRLRSMPKELYPSFSHATSCVGMRPDYTGGGNVRYIHRRLDEKDIYFVSHRDDYCHVMGTHHFRVADVKSVEWWDPLTGERRELPRWKYAHDGTVEVELELGPNESGFVVFSHGSTGMFKSMFSSIFTTKKSNFRSYGVLAELPDKWKVSFDPAWGGPEGEIEFETLEDWTKRPEWGIQHYSGIATYRKTVTSKEVPTHISLGDVANLARVKLNGKDLGSVWCWPWRVAVPEGAWKDGENLLEIEVANLWLNRLIGDASLPEEKRLTHTTVNPYKPTEPLRKSGLFGPVCLEREN